MPISTSVESKECFMRGRNPYSKLESIVPYSAETKILHRGLYVRFEANN
jgi:hypothetical protein